jgi:hypothetical protein
MQYFFSIMGLLQQGEGERYITWSFILNLTHIINALYNYGVIYLKAYFPSLY